MPISDNIKILRERYELTQKDLAGIARVSDKAVSTWEVGTCEPRIGTIQRIADHFGLQKSNIIEDGGMNFGIEKPAAVDGSRLAALQLSESALNDLERVLSLVGSLSAENCKKLIDYGALLLNSQKTGGDAK